jgi:hypothetical protein
VGVGLGIELGFEVDLGVVDALAEDDLCGLGLGGHGFHSGYSGCSGFFVVVGLLTEELKTAEGVGVGVAAGASVSQLIQ